ncbi:MAG: class poly(R)-hydroxyalkanoic acid synthase [Pseudomonadota bacterium]
MSGMSGTNAATPAQDRALKDTTKAPEAANAAPAHPQAPQAQTIDPKTGAAGTMPVPDFTALSQNLARLVEHGGRAAAAYFRPLEDGRTNTDVADQVEDAVKTLGHVAEHWLSDPSRAMEAQTKISGDMLELWARTLRKMSGEETKPVRAPDPGDKRFADPEWTKNPVYDFLAQAYMITNDWANDLITRADTLEPFEREKAQFYLRQIAGAVSPSNFIATNPELLRTTLEQSGENLVRGMQMLTEDIEAGKGQLKIRQSDASKFVLGRDMAATPGKVIYRNDLMELIQYAPSTETVFKRPLLICPPWINKFYVLDLNPEKSFIRWCVAQGLTVYVISWVNPDERQASKSFEDYMREGILTALDKIEESSGEKKVTAIGYCVGGTLLAIATAWMAATGDDRIDSVTFLTTQVDFTDAGELKLFVDQVRIKAIEDKMKETGYLEGSKMATAFNMLRPNELIWNYVVNNYLKGKEPMPFDLLVWNSDSTRMPAANHSFYLRNCYLENNLTQGRLDFGGVRLDLKKVTIPVYHLAAKEDHIAPARSVYTGAGYFGGNVKYVLAGSGHIAGVVNPAAKPKYQYWSGPPVAGSFDDWIEKATETPGTWWNDWIKWIEAQAPERVPAREPGGGKLAPLCDAPGDYVRVKA